MFSIFKESDRDGVESRLEQMLRDGERVFDLASGAVLGKVGFEEVRDEIWDLDKGINRAERSIRRELLVRGAVRHAESEQGLLLAFMSVAKDIERIGDYGKNIWDLANEGVSFGGATDVDLLTTDTEEVKSLMAAGREAFVAQNQRAVHTLIPQLEMRAAAHDEKVFEYARSETPGYDAVPRALYYRFLKRIVSHLENVLTSVVMPLDRIDYYKGSKATGRD